MYANIQKLKGKIVEKGFSGLSFSDQLTVDRSTFYRKLKTDGKDFTLKDVYEIVDLLQLSQSEAADIFLAIDSQM